MEVAGAVGPETHRILFPDSDTAAGIAGERGGAEHLNFIDADEKEYDGWTKRKCEPQG